MGKGKIIFESLYSLVKNNVGVVQIEIICRPQNKCTVKPVLRDHLYTAIYCFNPFPNKPLFLRVCSTGLLKTRWEKEKLLITSNFSSSHSVFYLFGERSTIFIQFEIIIRKLWKSVKFVIWERVKRSQFLYNTPPYIYLIEPAFKDRLL